MKIIKGLKGMAGSIKAAYKRFPIPLILAGISGVLLIAVNELGYNENSLGENLSKLIMVLMLGVPITIGLKLLWERLEKVKTALRLSAYAVTAIFLALYYLLLLRDLENVAVIRYVIISFIFYLTAACIACWFDRRNYEMYIIKIFSRFLITGIFALIMFGGIAGVLASIDGLLEINVPGKAYLYTFYIIATFFVPSYAFAGIPQDCRELDDVKYPKSLGVLLLYIMIPIICAYTVILYLYFVRVLIAWALPQGMVGNLVLWYSIVSIVVIFFVTPVIGDKRWVRSFMFWFTKLIIPCIVMLFIAVGIRINAYGVTESRYFVVLIGLWALGVFVYWNLKGVSRNIILPISLAAVLLISVAGPFSGFNVSIQSQSSRLKEIVKSYGMLEGSILKPTDKDISDKDKSTIRSILYYFDNNHSLSDVKFLPGGFKMEDVSEYFNFDPDDYYTGTSYFSYGSEAGGVVDIRGYDYLISLDQGGPGGQKVEFGDSYAVAYSGDDETIGVDEGSNRIYSCDVKGFAEKLHKNHGEEKYQLPQKEMIVEDGNSSISIKIMFTNLSGAIDEYDGSIEIESFACSVYIRMK